jgi:hypothetical protein
MAIKWNLVLGKALGTMAEREDEYRKFATDYFTKKYETYAEEKKAWNETTREQKREINKKIDALRAEGLSDTQIANGLNTYGENFFAVVADDLKTFKSSDNYRELLRNDTTGGKFRQAYRDRFDSLLVTEQQRALEIEPVVKGLLDKFPVLTETPEITQSIFGFDYTKGIRDDIKGLSKGTEVPDYDAPAGLVGVSNLMTGTIRDVPQQQTYTGNMLDKQIVMRLEARFGDLGVAMDGTRFETKAEMTAKEIEQVRKAKAAQLKVQRKFNEERLNTPPGSVEGGMSDQQLLDKIISDLGYGAIASKKETGNGATDPVDFDSNISSFMQNNPQSPVSKLVTELQNIDGADATTVQNILSAIGSGKSVRSAVKGLNISSSVLNRINNYISNLDEEDKAIIAGFGSASAKPSDETNGTQTEQTKQDVVARPDTSELKGRAKRVAQDMADAWDSTYGVYINPDGTLKEGVTQDKFDAALPLIQSQYQKEIDALKSINPFD